MIPYGKQTISQADIDAVVRVLQSDFLTQGERVPEFEQNISQYCGAKYAVAVNSATSALHIACLALGLGEGDVLWTSPITFVASANVALYCGAKVDFVDINLQTGNLSVEHLEAKLREAKLSGCLPKIVMPVHLAGEPCDMAKIFELSKEYGFKIIEDASHAIGASYHDKKIGACEYSDITVFSFHPVKIITTAEGGLATTNQIDLYEKMALLRSHGVTRQPSQMAWESEGDWYYQQIDLGYNYRMTELQAALGISQMCRLDEFVAKRHELAGYYDKQLKKINIILPHRSPTSYSALHLYPIRMQPENQQNRKQVFDYLRQNKIGVNVHYIPVHTQPYYQQLGFCAGDFPNAEQYYASTISLPLYFELTENQQNQIIETLSRALS